MIARLLILLIEKYQERGGGTRLGFDCNFEPSCSEYAKQSIATHGIFRGVWLTVDRLRRCSDPNCVEKTHDPIPNSQT